MQETRTMAVLSHAPLTALAKEHTAKLFQPQRIGALLLKNRLVMAPMTRTLAPAGIPGEANATYYRKRAAGGAGLIITEGTWVPHDAASNEVDVPRIYGVEALAGWKKVVDAVHAEDTPICERAVRERRQMAAPIGNAKRSCSAGRSFDDRPRCR